VAELQRQTKPASKHRVVRRHDEGCSSIARSFHQEPPDFCRRLIVERPSWLISEQQAGISDQCPSDRRSLHLPSGQLVSTIVGAVRETKSLDQFHRL